MQTECPYRIVLADDHAMFRHDLMRILRERSDLEVTGEAGDGRELLEVLCLIVPAPNMAIVDITMPHIDGIKATAAIKRTYPDMKVLILSMHQEGLYVQRAPVGRRGWISAERECGRRAFSGHRKNQAGRGVSFATFICSVTFPAT